MDLRQTATRSTWWLLIAGIVALALVVTLGATSASAAKSDTCSVTNKDSGRTYTGVQQAVDAAKQGVRLTVRGICRGTTVIDRDIAIEGIRTEHAGKPTLSGAGRVRVLLVEHGATVTLSDLDIVRGLAGHGAGIRNRGDLTLRDVQVRRNSTGDDNYRGLGAGVYNEGRLRLNGATRIASNIYGYCTGVHNRGRLIMNGDSLISRNDPFLDGLGGVCNQQRAVLTMNGRSSLRGNAEGQFSNLGQATMNDEAWIRPESRDDDLGGAGVDNVGTFTMNDRSSIRDGLGEAWGVSNHGLPQVSPLAMFTMNDASSISGNPGGGLRNGQGGIIRMNDNSSIYDNRGICFGGGAQIWGGRLRMTGSSSITGNSLVAFTEEVTCDSSLRGGGLYQSGGALIGVTCGPGGNVYGNTPDDCYIE